MRGRIAAPIKGLYQHDFTKLAASEGTARERRRFLAFAHIQDGCSFSEAGRRVKVDTRTVMTWIRKYRKFGIEGLREKPGRGAKPALPPEKYEEFRQSVEELQKNRAGGRIRGKDVEELLESKYGIQLCLSGVYKLLKKVKLVWITGRSQHPKSDPRKQQAFKKTSKNLSCKQSQRGLT